MQKFAVHAGGCASDGGEKRNVLIGSVLLPIAIDLALRSKTQNIEVLGVGEVPVLLNVATVAKPLVRDG